MHPPLERIDHGLRALCAEQRPTQTLTSEAIAHRCGVHKKAIQSIEDRALLKLGRGLHTVHRSFMRECFPETKIPANRLPRRRLSSTQTQCT